MSKKKRREAAVAAEAAERLRPKPPRHAANNPKGPVMHPRTDGPGVTLRCDRCGATTVTAGKRAGNRCGMTRGCHGYLRPARSST